MKTLSTIVISLLVLSSAMFGQAVGDYGTGVVSGTWTTAAHWIVCVSPGTWSGATVAVAIPSTTTNVWIRNGYTMTIPASGTINCKDVNIENGGTLNSTTTPATSNRYLKVYGNITNNGTFGGLTDGLSLNFNANCIISGTPTSFICNRFQPNVNSITITFNCDVSCLYPGSGGTGGAGIYANAKTGIAYAISAGKTLTLGNLCNFTIGTSTQSDGAVGMDLTVDGTLTFQTGGNGGKLAMKPGTGNTANITVNNGGTINLGQDFLQDGLGTTNITVNSGGAINNLASGRSITLSGAGTSVVVNGTGTFTTGANTLTMGGIAISGTGTFTLSSGGTISISNSSGLEPVAGPIRTTTVTLSSGAKYEYAGTSAQVTGAQLPGEINGLSITNPAGLTLTNNLIVDSTMTFKYGTLSLGGNTFGYGTSAVRLTYADSLAVTTSVVEFPNDGKVKTLVINKAAAVNPANFGNVTLHAARTVDSLTLTNGNLVTTGANLLTLSATKAVPVSGGSSASFVNGPLAISYATAGGTFSMTYPIGKGAIYRPLTLSLTQAGATSSAYIAEMFNSAPAAYAFPGTLNPTEPYTVSKVRYYNIAEAAAGSTFTAGAVTLSYAADDSVTDMANLRVAQGPGGGTWNDLGGAGTANTTGTITSTSFFTSLVSPDPGTVFTLANNLAGTNPLPVELTSFTLSMQSANCAILKWSTATEVNNSGFEIERRAEVSSAWAKVSFVSGAGTTASPKEYSFIDRALAAGRYSYRLKQVDNDGNFRYYGTEAIVEVGAAPKTLKLEANYPNPFNPTTSIDFTVAKDGKAALRVYNVLGEEIAILFNGDARAGQIYHATFDAGRLPSGLYFARLESGDSRMVQKMLLTK
jgi:hypothetical protein